MCWRVKLSERAIMGATTSGGMTWLVFALLTVVSWGVYGIFLHTGQTSMGGDPALARYKAFLFVGIAYFLTAVLAPLFLLMTKGAAFSGYSSKGMWWSLIAGIVGAIGAFGVLLAFGAGGKPGVVMSIVFAGAPIVNAEPDGMPNAVCPKADCRCLACFTVTRRCGCLRQVAMPCA